VVENEAKIMLLLGVSIARGVRTRQQLGSPLPF
jgi:hypothetical protein